MPEFTLTAQLREPGSRGQARRLRRLEGRVPAVLYGGGEVIKLSLPADSLNRYAAEEAFYTHILQLEIGSDKHEVVVKEVQRHPYKRVALHIDFLRVQKDRKLTMHVPIHILNEAESAGVRVGGIVNHLINELEIRCLPRHIPEYVEVDITDLEIEHTLHLSQLSLPEGVELVHPVDEGHDPGVVAIHKPRAEVVAEPAEEEAAEAEAEAEAGAEGAAEPAAKA